MIGKKAAFGGAILVGTRLFSRVLDLVAMVVIARILTPGDFGLVALAMSFVIIVEAVLELPLTQAMLRLDDIERAHYDSAFTLSILRGCVLYLCVLIISFPVTHIYGDDRLFLLLQVVGAAPLLKSFASPMLVDFQRALSFWRDAAVELSAKICGVVASISCAALGTGYWSIAIGLLCTNSAYSLISFILAPYRPRLSFARMGFFARFSGWISLAQVAIALNWQVENLVLGRLGSSTQLGLFKVGSDLAGIPFQALFGPLARPLIAVFSKIKASGASTKGQYLLASSYMMAIGLPIMTGIAVTAPFITRVFLGDQWDAAAPILHLLALSTIPALFTVAAYPLVIAAGQTKIVFQQNIADLVVRVPSTIAGIYFYGLNGLIGARLISELFRNIYIMKTIKDMEGISISGQVTYHARYLVSAGAMYFIVLTVEQILIPHFRSDQSLARLVVASFIGACFYFVSIFIGWLVSGRPPGIEQSVVNFLKEHRGRIARANFGKPDHLMPKRKDPAAP